MSFKNDARFIAAVDLIKRTGAKDFRIGYSDEEDGEPIVWYAVATYNRSENMPPEFPDVVLGDVDASFNPVQAVLRLCERLIDGGECWHCHQMTIFISDITVDPFDKIGCVYAWDPELKTFRRSCEGEDGE